MIFLDFLKHPFKRFLSLTILFAFIIFCFFPLFWMLLTAFKSRVDFLATTPKFLFTPTLENFKSTLASQDFLKAYLNSVIVSVSTVATSLLLGVPVAYGLSRFKFKGKSDLAFWILSTRFAPAVVVLIPFFLIYRSLNLYDTYTGLTIIYLVNNLPLVIWVMYGFFKEIPIELEEAATVDGASPFRSFFQVVLPMVKPGMVATSILVVIFTWNELMFAITLTASHTRTLPMAIYNFVSYSQIDWGSLSSSGMLAILPVVIFALIIQKHLVSGLTFGAVKE